MARVVSLTLFLWLLLFSYAASGERNKDTPSIECQVCSKVVDRIYQRVQNKEAQKCPKKEIKIFDYTDVADFLCKIQPVIDKLANRVCYELYPDACPGKPASTEDIISVEQFGPKPSNGAEMERKDFKKFKTSNKKGYNVKNSLKIRWPFGSIEDLRKRG